MNFELSRKQAMALRSPAHEVLYGGAAGAGKSYLLRVASIVYASMIPGLVVFLFRRTHPQLHANHMMGPSSYWHLLADEIKRGVVDYNTKFASWFFDNGSVIRLCHCQHEKDVWEYQGNEPHVILLDEATRFSEQMYRILRSFLRIGESLGLPEQYKPFFPKLISATNPIGIGAAFLKSVFVDKSRNAEHIWLDDDYGMPIHRQYIPADRRDNKYLDESYEARLRSLGDEDLVSAMLSGDWNQPSGLFFSDAWDEDINVVEPFRIPATWYVDRSLDWGFAKPYSVGYWAQADGSSWTDERGVVRWYPTGTLFRVGELYGARKGAYNAGVREHGDQVARRMKEYEQGTLKRWLNGNDIHPGPADLNIWDASVPEDTAYLMAREGISWQRANKSPGTRVNGWRNMHRMFQASGNSVEIPGLYVFDTCLDFRRTVPSLPRDERNVEDVDTNTEDHVGDEARYRVLQLSEGVSSIHLPI